MKAVAAILVGMTCLYIAWLLRKEKLFLLSGFLLLSSAGNIAGMALEWPHSVRISFAIVASASAVVGAFMLRKRGAM